MFFFQPFATKVLANYSTLRTEISYAREQINPTTPESPTRSIDSIVLDAEDEDEFSDFKNSVNDKSVAFDKTGFSSSYISQNSRFFNKGVYVNYTYSCKPLYILWSVFRI